MRTWHGRAAAGGAGTDDVLRLRVAAGFPPDDLAGVSGRGRRAVAVATAVGAPLAAAVDGAMAAEDDVARARRAVRVASAETRAVAIGLLAAPAVLVPGLGRLVGADLRGFYTTRAGVLVLAVGVTLLLLGGLVVMLLIRRIGATGRAEGLRHRLTVPALVLAGLVAWRLVGPVLVPVAVLLARLAMRRPSGHDPAAVTAVDEAADLTATALAGGLSSSEALRTVSLQLPVLATELHRLAFELELGLDGSGDRAAAQVPGVERLRTVLTTADQLGAPAAPALRRLAADLRADELARVLAAAERLPAQLTFPTTLLLLPGTVLLVGAPIVHAGLAATGV